MKQFPILPILAVTLFACSSDDGVTRTDSGDAVTHAEHAEHGEHSEHAGHAAEAAEATAIFQGPELDAAAWSTYGAGVHQGDAVSVEQVLANPADYADQPVRLRGAIASVCKKKGCWVRVGDAEHNVFTKFKDYGFFLPTDATGEVVLEGYVKVETISVDELKHYLMDEGKPEEAAKVTEPETQVQFLAHGAAVKK